MNAAYSFRRGFFKENEEVGSAAREAEVRSPGLGCTQPCKMDVALGKPLLRSGFTSLFCQRSV